MAFKPAHDGKPAKLGVRRHPEVPRLPYTAYEGLGAELLSCRPSRTKPETGAVEHAKSQSCAGSRAVESWKQKLAIAVPKEQYLAQLCKSDLPVSDSVACTFMHLGPTVRTSANDAIVPAAASESPCVRCRLRAFDIN